MTSIEMDVARSQIRANKAIASLAEIDWEQRRYEISKEMLPSIVVTIQKNLLAGARIEELNTMTLGELASQEAVDYADALIKELKGK